MADLIKKIHTSKGDLQIDYNALANLPSGFTYQTTSITTGSESTYPEGTITFVYEVPTTTIELIVWPVGQTEIVDSKTYSNIPQGLTWRQLLDEYGYSDHAYAWIEHNNLYCGSYANIYEMVYTEGDPWYPTMHDYLVAPDDIIKNGHTYYADGN